MKVNKKKIIAVVPARGGSKGVPRKNIRLLNRFPLIYYSLKTLCAIKEIDKIIVSTEDKKIKEVVEKLKLDVDISIRPKYLAKDSTPLTSVVHYESKKIFKKGFEHGYVLQVSPASPFLRANTVKMIINLLTSGQSNCVVTLKKIEHEHPYRAKILNRKNYFTHFIKNINVEKFISRQDLPKLYCTSGSLYARSYELLSTFTGKDFCLGNNPMGVIVDDVEAVNIDRPIDFEFANFLALNKKI